MFVGLLYGVINIIHHGSLFIVRNASLHVDFLVSTMIAMLPHVFDLSKRFLSISFKLLIEHEFRLFFFLLLFKLLN